MYKYKLYNYMLFDSFKKKLEQTIEKTQNFGEVITNT